MARTRSKFQVRISDSLADSGKAELERQYQKKINRSLRKLFRIPIDPFTPPEFELPLSLRPENWRPAWTYERRWKGLENHLLDEDGDVAEWDSDDGEEEVNDNEEEAEEKHLYCPVRRRRRLSHRLPTDEEVSDHSDSYSEDSEDDRSWW
jgi:hypothetical protein